MAINLTHPSWKNGCHFADDIFGCIFVNEKFWILIKIEWSLFLGLQLTISQHWFRKWLGAEYAKSYYLNQWWPDSLTHICGTLWCCKFIHIAHIPVHITGRRKGVVCVEYKSNFRFNCTPYPDFILIHSSIWFWYFCMTWFPVGTSV